MRAVKVCAMAALFVLLLNADCMSHAIKASAGEGGVYVRTFYDDGTPVPFAEVKVYTPLEKEFLSGVTDINGMFAFVPDDEGEWKVKIDDGMGHRIVKVLSVGEGDVLIQDGHEGGFPRLFGVITGVSLIFGLCGLFALFGNRRRK